MNAPRSNPRSVVLITGASAGIGAAAVSVFAAAGYDVVLTARRKDRLEQVAADVHKKYASAKLLPVSCDVSSDSSVEALFKTVSGEFSQLDALINNAGYGCYGSVEATPLDDFRANMETNYLGVIRCTQAALPLLRQAAKGSRRRWGAAVVMVSSVVGRRSLPMLSSYCATKFALEALSESLRAELFDDRISVSVVNPGVTQTDFVGAAKGARPKNFISQEGGMSAEAVARVLLRAVRHPRRNRYLTAAGKAGMLLQWLAPTLFDCLMVRVSRSSRRPLSPEGGEGGHER